MSNVLYTKGNSPIYTKTCKRVTMVPTTQTTPNPAPDAASKCAKPELELGSMSGTAAPIVKFTQSKNGLSTHAGSGMDGRLSLSLNAEVSLYPSSVRTTLLAR